MKLSHRSEVRLGSLLLGYIFFCWAVKLVFLTLVTYFFMSSRTNLRDIGDIVKANQVVTYGIATLIYIFILQKFHPITTTRWEQIFPFPQFKKHFLSHAAHGMMTACALLLGLTLGGFYSFLGIYIKFDEVVLSLFSMAFFSISLFLITLMEEYILRHCVEPYLEHRWHRPLAMTITMMLYVIIKYFQFDITWHEALNLALLSLCLSTLCKNEHSFLASTGFATGFFILLHMIFSLPMMGQDTTGIFMLRTTKDTGFAALLSGGDAGPEKSLVLTVLLLVYWSQRSVRYRGAHK